MANSSRRWSPKLKRWAFRSGCSFWANAMTCPIFFAQRRYGLNSEEIRVLKFRTMTVCEDGDDVVQAVKVMLYDNSPVEEYSIPANRFDLAALIHRTGRVVHEDYLESGVVIRAQVPPKTRGVCAAYLTG